MLSFAVWLAVLLPLAAAIPRISITGSKFFRGDGSQYYIKGIAYQLSDDDPLVDTNQCQMDASLMKELGTNAIRVYHVDASANHDGCMQAFADAGIYLFVDMDSFKTYIRYDTTPSWTQNKSESYRHVVDAFHKYDNTAGFFVGNEVLNGLVDSSSAPYLLTAAADIKGYITARGYRTIPIGYTATDSSALEPMLEDYLVCRPNATERLDFYALNSYRWCGGASSYKISGYDQIYTRTQEYPVPIFFSEVGCITARPRDFADQAAVLGPDMSGVWSGAIIYEWVQEANDYGLVSYNADSGATVIAGFARGGQPTPISPDFNNLKNQWATLNPTGNVSSVYAQQTAKILPPPCPVSTAGGWSVDANAVLPTLGDAGVTPATSTDDTASALPPTTGSRTISTATRTGASAASATHTGAASNSGGVDSNVMAMTLGLVFVGFGFVLWL